ncbi:Tat binding protein 1-interacting protein-domain-containing protein [Fennellomyces sp. T-0311]|nr:Tat binding protein 1-interacting protein-domain-containing protein [Fennellomyces sp. T-0311]
MTKKKSTSGEDDKAVLDYLRKVNRPYSATDIFNNLHAKYPKPGIVKALERLTDQQVIVTKTYGKTNIYTAKQSTDDLPSSEEQSAMEKQMESLSKELETLKRENQELSRNLHALKSSPTNDELDKLIATLAQENETHRSRLDKLKSGTTLITAEEKTNIDKEYDTMRKEWRTRRKLFREIFNTVTEHMPGQPKAFKEELGIEEDPIPYEQDPLADVGATSSL